MEQISQSSQDYLEAILYLSNSTPLVKSIDIASHLNVSRASVNKAINSLKEKGYVMQEKYSLVQLTPLGLEMAKDVLEKHVLLEHLLIDILQVSPKIAKIDACKMEHYLSKETLVKLKIFINKQNNS